MDALVTLALLAVLLAAPCFVQLVLWTAYRAVRAGVALSTLAHSMHVQGYPLGGNRARNVA